MSKPTGEEKCKNCGLLKKEHPHVDMYGDEFEICPTYTKFNPATPLPKEYKPPLQQAIENKFQIAEHITNLPKEEEFLLSIKSQGCSISISIKNNKRIIKEFYKDKLANDIFHHFLFVVLCREIGFLLNTSNEI